MTSIEILNKLYAYNPFFLHHLVAYLLFMRKNFCRVHHHARYNHSGTFLHITLRVPIPVLVVNKRHYWQEDKVHCCTQNVKEYKVESAFEFLLWFLFSRIWHNHSNFNRFVFTFIFCIEKYIFTYSLYEHIIFILMFIQSTYHRIRQDWVP